MTLEPITPREYDVPEIPKISDLRKMDHRKIESALLKACPENWHDVFKEMLDSAHLYSHDLNLPRLVAELNRIRLHERAIRRLEDAEYDLLEAGCLIHLYATVESGPDNLRLRGVVADVIREVIREELSDVSHAPERKPSLNERVYFQKKEGVTLIWTGPGKPDAGNGKWLPKEFIYWKPPASS